MGNIISKILKNNAKIIHSSTTISTCAHCKKEIDPRFKHVRFTGEHLHNDCLIDYLQKIGVLEVFSPQGSGDKR